MKKLLYYVLSVFIMQNYLVTTSLAQAVIINSDPDNSIFYIPYKQADVRVIEPKKAEKVVLAPSIDFAVLMPTKDIPGVVRPKIIAGQAITYNPPT